MNIKHLLFCALALLTSLCANAQECNVPISVQLESISKNTFKNKYDKRWKNFNRLLERHGFTSEVHNTRVAVSLVTILENEYCTGQDRLMSIEIRFNDSYSGSVFYATKLDKQYCGYYYDAADEFADDLTRPMPELDSLVDSIRTCVVNAYEANSRHMAELAHDYAKQGDHDIALFALVQYPSCCPSYPKITNVMRAIFRDYMKKDHDALFDVAKSVWRNRETEADARFVISLLNSVQFDKSEQRKADRLFRKITKEYPTLDLKARKDYTTDADLKDITLREARNIGIEYSISDDIFPDTEHKVPSQFREMRMDYLHRYSDFYDNDYYVHDFDYDWYSPMMDFYTNVW